MDAKSKRSNVVMADPEFSPPATRELVIERREVIARFELVEGGDTNVLSDAFAMCAGYLSYQHSPEGGGCGARLVFQYDGFEFVIETEALPAGGGFIPGVGSFGA